MTRYEKELIRMIGMRFGELTPQQLVEKLTRIGVIDITLCKVLTIREFVAALQKNGMKKIDAMWMASEQFACTYEYVRKCMYYYTDVNLYRKVGFRRKNFRNDPRTFAAPYNPPHNQP